MGDAGSCTRSTKRRRADTTLAAEVLGWQPRTPVADGLKRTLGWFADEVENG